MLSVRQLEVSFTSGRQQVPALRGVDLQAPAGRLTAILGPSGCGKTTLLRAVAGFLTPQAGSIALADRTLSAPDTFVPPQRRGIAVVAQEGALFPHLSVQGNVGFGLTAAGRRMSRRERRRRVDEVLEMVGLADYADRHPDELSGGQQQRVSLARALAPRPSVVLLDEPFSAVDAGLRLELGRQVTDLLRRLETTAIMVTHDQSEALSLADHVAVMREGLVVQQDSPDRLYAQPADAQTAAFVGDVVLLPACVAEAGCADCALGRLPLIDGTGCHVAGEHCTLMLRPEQLHLTQQGVPALVCSSTFYGHDATVQARLGENGDGDVVLLRVQGGPLPEVGSRVSIGVRGGALSYLN